MENLMKTGENKKILEKTGQNSNYPKYQVLS